MTNEVLVLGEAAGDSYIDPTFELLGKARQLAGAWGGRSAALVIGPAPDPGGLDADLVITVSHPRLDSYTPEGYLEVLHAVVAQRDPKLILLPNTTIGMDLGAALSVRWGRPLVAYAVDVVAEGEAVVATSQLFGGRLHTEAVLEGGQGICTVVAGSFAKPQRRSQAPAPVEAFGPPPALESIRTVSLGTPVGEDEDIDITKAPMLVAIGRGLKSQDNVAVAEALAEALGASVSGTSQVCDLGWLPRTRHVGKSGVKVRPRAYLAFGISGAPEHLEGIRESELIIACNTDAAAPIFSSAHYGTTLDAIELMRAMTERLQ